MTDRGDNEKIARWLGRCLDWQADIPPNTRIHPSNHECQMCGFNELYHDVSRLQYDTDPTDALALLDAVKVKGIGFVIRGYEGKRYEVSLWPRPENPYVNFTADADSLPAAIAAAVVKLIDSKEMGTVSCPEGISGCDCRGWGDVHSV